MGIPDKFEKILLSIAFVLGVSAIGFSLIAIIIDRNLIFSPEINFDSLNEFSKLIFDSSAMLVLEQPVPPPNNIWFLFARIFSVMFAGFGIATVLFHISKVLTRKLIVFFYFLNIKWFKNKSVLMFGGNEVIEIISKNCIENKNSVQIYCEDNDYVRLSSNLKSRLCLINPFQEFFKKIVDIGIRNISDIFISMGNDTLTLKCAIRLEHLLNQLHLRNQIKCYLNIESPNFSEIIRDRKLLQNIPNKINFYQFSVRQIASYKLLTSCFLGRKDGLFFGDKNGCKLELDEDKKFKLFVIGFDLIGQVLVSTYIRLAHFPNLKPPHISIIGNERDRASWASFLINFPRACPPKNGSINSPNSDWNALKSANNPSVIEYASHINFSQINSNRQILKELDSNGIKDYGFCCIAIARESDEECFQDSIYLQNQLHKHNLYQNLEIKLFAYARDSFLLTEVCKLKNINEDSKNISLHPFGQQDQILNYNSITKSGVFLLQDSVKKAYRILSGKNENHQDFDISNYECVLHSEIGFNYLGIKFSQNGLDESLPNSKKVLDDYFTKEINEKYSSLMSGNGNELELSKEEFENLNPQVRERLCLLKKVKRTEKISSGMIRNEAKKLIVAFEKEVGQNKAYRAAQMEHNRWISERLMRGWKYGERSNLLKQRTTFVNWDELKEEDQFYDRQILPTIICVQREYGKVAYTE